MQYFQDFTNYFGVAMDGPAKFRFVIQPMIAIILGIFDGFRDHKAGRVPHLAQMIGGKGDRKEAFKKGASTAWKPISVAFLLDLFVRWYLVSEVRPLDSLLVGTFLVALPYGLMRGRTNRILIAIDHRKEAHKEA